MLGSRDPLPHRPQRILIAGVTGAGKSTLARRIAAQLEIHYTEIDSLFHGPNWTRRDEFLTDVDSATSQASWVTEWQYASARPRLVQRADTLIWLDHSVPISLGRLIRRTIRRGRTREVLWNGNIEPPLHRIFLDKENIIRWALATQFMYKRVIPALADDQPHLQVIRLRSQRGVDRWMSGPLASL